MAESGSAAADAADPAPGPATFWETRPSPAARSAPTCDDAPDHRGHPRTGRPAEQPVTPGQQRQTPTRFRRRALQAAQRRQRAINKLKGFRAVATRYHNCDFMFRATVDVAMIRIWLRDPVS
jgi:hypothetical protein